MAELDLETIEAQAHPDTANGRVIRDLVDELKRRRYQAEQDLRFMQQQIAEVGSLKRRLTALRRSCRLRSSVGNVTAREVLREDDERRRRFEKKRRVRR